MKTGITLSAAALMVLLAIAGFAVPHCEAQQTKRIYVQHLAWPDKLDAEMVRGKAKENPLLLKSYSAVLKLVDKKATNKLIAGVDFKEEMSVLVLWETGGPLYGNLDYEVKGNELNFFVEAPDPDQLWKLRRGSRGKALQFNADFFVVPRDVPVTFEPGERPFSRQ